MTILVNLSVPKRSKIFPFLPWLLLKNGKMGLKFFNIKPSFLKLKAILENKTSFGVETVFFQNCLASRNVLCDFDLDYIVLLGLITIANFCIGLLSFCNKSHLQYNWNFKIIPLLQLEFIIWYMIFAKWDIFDTVLLM